MIDDLKTFCGAKRAVRQFCRYTEEIRLPEDILHILINSKCHNSEKCMMLSEEEFIKKFKECIKKLKVKSKKKKKYIVIVK